MRPMSSSTKPVPNSLAIADRYEHLLAWCVSAAFENLLEMALRPYLTAKTHSSAQFRQTLARIWAQGQKASRPRRAPVIFSLG